MKSADAAISFEHVYFRIDGQSILEDITGSFPPGKITTLLAPSGSGKTTLLKLCNGLISPNSGTITVEGQAIHSYAPTELRRLVGIALQQAPMIKGTVLDNLTLPLSLQGKSLDKNKAVQLLEDVGLNKTFLEHDSHDLSGGQKQRVAIARTLINESKILLLDEITSGLDQEAAQGVEHLIQMTNDKYGVTIIWITHNIKQAQRVGDYMWMINDGKVVETGDIALLETSTNEQIRHFVQGGTS